jgi:excisionase family DNA binding protein
MVTPNANSTAPVDLVDRPLLRPDEIAAFLGIPLGTIYRLRSRGDGPVGIRVGRHLRYRVQDVVRWLDDHRESHACDRLARP